MSTINCNERETMRFHFSGLHQFWALALALTLLVSSVCWAGELELSPAEQTWLDAHPVIQMSVEVGYGPYTFLDAKGQLQGVAMEFFADIERLLGIRFEIVSNLSWTQQMEAVRERRLDAVATVVKLPERETFLEFTEIYLPTPLVIMTRSETPQLHSLKELQQLRLSLVKGYSSSKQLIARFPSLRPRYVTTPLEGLRSVASGATDAYIGVLGVNSFLMARNGITNLKVNAAFDMADNGQRFGVRKDWPQLARLLNKALLAISTERKNAIFQRWLPLELSEIERLSRPGYVTRLFPWLLGALGLALVCWFVLFIFNRRLRKAVETRTQELSRTNEKLHESEQRYRAVAEDTPVLICRFLPGGEITYANEAYCTYFDKTSEELIGSSFFSLIPDAERETVMTNISAMTVESPNQSHEHQVIGAEGEIRWTRWTNRALFDAQGKAVAYQSIGEDITDRKLSDESLQIERDNLHNIFEAIEDGIYIVNQQYDIQYVNPVLVKDFGSYEDVKCYRYFHDRDEVCPWCKNKDVQAGKTVRWEWYSSKNGKTYDLLDTPMTLPDGSRGKLEIFRDITERKQAEEELATHREHLEELVEDRTHELKEKTDKIEESRKALTYLVEDVNKARKDLEKANRDIGAANTELQDFAYIVSHDLKAPLRAVSQLAYWISQDYAEVLDEDGKEHLNLLSSRVKRMDGLINGILQYSRLGRAKEKQDKIDLAKTLPSVIEALAPPENIRITIEDELPEIVGNSTHMEQVFQNLLGNAIKFMDKPEGLITIGCRDEGSRWEFRITDNGPGIDEKYHERIFKIFQTLVPRDEHESTGIGLTLVKKTIEQYDGKVWVESQVGKGSSFVFTLPKK